MQRFEAVLDLLPKGHVLHGELAVPSEQQGRVTNELQRHSENHLDMPGGK